MKRTIRILALLSAAILLITLGSGCTSGIYKKKGNGAIDYINKKYQREFTPLSYDLSDYLSDSDTVECYTEGMDPEKENVSIYVPKNMWGKYHDNYFDFIVRDEVENHVSEMFKSRFGECKVYKSTNGQPLPDELKEGNTIDDLYKLEPNYEIRLQVFLKDSLSAEEQREGAKEVIEELAKEDRINVIQVFAAPGYDSITRYDSGDFSDLTDISYVSIVRGEIKEYD